MLDYNRIRVACCGLGSIGIQVVRVALKKPFLEIVATIDNDPEKVGKDLGEILELNKRLGIKVQKEVDDISEVGVDVVLHTTSSKFREIYPQIEQICLSGMNCVSSTEELFFPYSKYFVYSQQLDRLAKAHGVTVLGAGVNPGFVMDLLPLLLTFPCQEVQKIKIERIVDASSRRKPLQEKIGVSLTIDEFNEKVRKKTLGHVGLIESLVFIANSVGWKLDNTKEKIQPIIAQKQINTQFFAIARGRVCGMRNIVVGTMNNEKIITLDLQMFMGAKNPHDLIIINGKPNLRVHIDGGVPGDIATVSILVNSLPFVVKAKPGLLTVRDFPLLHWKLRL